MDGDAIRPPSTRPPADLGLVAMKTQGAGEFREIGASPRFTTLLEKRLKRARTAIKAVFSDERIQVVY